MRRWLVIAYLAAVVCVSAHWLLVALAAKPWRVGRHARAICRECHQ